MPVFGNKFHFVVPQIVMSKQDDEIFSAKPEACDTCLSKSPEIRCSPSPCIFDRSPSSSPRPRRRSHRSCSPASPRHRKKSDVLAPGYEQYQRSLLEVPVSTDYGYASSDDLSSEWDSDVPDVPQTGQSKVRQNRD